MNNHKALIPALTTIRIFAAIWIILFHIGPRLFEAFPILSFFKPLIARGYIGVDLFFILSGFVIWYNYGDRFAKGINKKEIKKFILKRFVRLWPLHLLGTILALFIMLISIYYFGNFGASAPDWFNIKSFVTTAMLMQILNSPTPTYIWNQPAWAVSAEFIIYLIFPLISLILLKTVNKLKLLPVVIITILIFLFEIFMSRSARFDFSYGWFLRFVLVFISGNLVGIVYSKADNKPKLINFLGILQYILPLIMMIILFFGIDFSVTGLIALWILALALGKTKLNKYLSKKTFVLLGSMSYALYIIHWVALAFMVFILIKWPQFAENYLGLILFATIIGIFVISYLLWKFIEEPSAKYLKKLFKI